MKWFRSFLVSTAVAGRYDFVYYDDGLKAYDSYQPTKTSKIYDRALVIDLNGSISSKTSFDVDLDLFGTHLVKQAVIAWQEREMFGLRVGQDYVNTGGWEAKNWNFSTLLVSPYNQYLMPWIKGEEADSNFSPASAPSVTALVTLEKLGTISVQAINDVVVGEDEAAKFSHTHRQPSLLLEWKGQEATLTPLFQYGNYDMNHSAIYALGLKLHVGAVTATSDFLVDHRKTPELDGLIHVTEYRSTAHEVQYAGQDFELFAKIVAMETKQSIQDQVGNQPGLLFDNNALHMAIGARYALDGDAFKPFLAVTRRSGRFLKDGSDPTGATQTKSDLAMTVGLTSEWK